MTHDPILLVIVLTIIGLSFAKGIHHMSSSVSSLQAAVVALSVSVEAATAKIAALASASTDAADLAAIDSAVVDISAATAKLVAAVG